MGEIRPKTCEGRGLTKDQLVGEEIVVYDTGTCSGWCSFPVTCTNAEAGDCTPNNYVSSGMIAGGSGFCILPELQQ